jgi:hypothetical protein
MFAEDSRGEERPGADPQGGASAKTDWSSAVLLLAIVIACVIVVMFFLRNELRSCFGGCGPDGCGVCGSVSRAPGP